MSKEDIFNYFYTNSTNLGITTILYIMVAAFLIATLICATYYFSFRGTAYNNKLNTSLLMITLISTIIMLMISSNIVISLGMVGALSIVRFRTAMKDSRDTVYLFWAMTEGLCVGSQNFKLAIVTTLFMAILLLALSYLPKIWHKYLLVVTGGKVAMDLLALNQKLDEKTLWHKLRTTSKDEQQQEAVFELVTRREWPPDLLDEILSISGIQTANVVMQAGETVG